MPKIKQYKPIPIMKIASKLKKKKLKKKGESKPMCNFVDIGCCMQDSVC